MTVTIHRTLPAWDALAPEWTALWRRMPERSPFLTYEFLRAWWPTLGAPGEWPHGTLAIVTLHDAGTLIGLVPFFHSVNHDGEPVLAVIGSDVLTDALGILAEPGHAETVLQVMMNWLRDEPDWSAVDWYNLPDNSPVLATLTRIAPEYGFTADREEITPCSFIPLPTSWDDYLGQLTKKDRHELKRKRNRLNDVGATFRILDDATEWETVATLLANHPEKQWLSQPPLAETLARLMHAHARAGVLRLAFLEVQGAPIAAVVFFDTGTTLHFYNCGVAAAWRTHAPGIVLFSKLLETAIARGDAHVDFLRGDDDYKRRLGAISRPLWRLSLKQLDSH